MERWLRDIEDYLVASDRFEEEIDGKNFDLIRKALDRMKPKEPMYSYEGTGKCPVCRDLVNTTEDKNFCWNCGQRLDWAE